MRHHSTPRNSGQDDLIDFACSDTFRDHYAAQGLTYAAGRYKQKTPLRLPVWTDEIAQDSQSRFVHVGKLLPDVLKEIARRFELRQRLEAERGGPISDQEFIEVAERDEGCRL